MEDRDRGRAVLKMPKAEQGVFFNDRKDENGKVNDRGLIGIRGRRQLKASWRRCVGRRKLVPN